MPMALNGMHSGIRKIKAFVCLLGILLLPYIALCLYAYPAADDFSYTPTSPFWKSQWDILMHWNGRYIANFFILCNPAIWLSFTGYRLVAFFLIILIPLSFYFLISAATGNSINRWLKVIFALVVSSLIIAMFPSLAEGIYWYPGSISYILGAIFATFYAGVTIKYIRKQIIIAPSFHLAFCILLLFLAIGFNEVQMLVLLFLHLVIWFKVPKRERFSSPWLILLIACILFSCIMLFSPGNHGRGSYFTDNYRPLYSLGMTLMQMVRFFFSWVSYGPLWVATILFIPVSRLLARRSPLFQKLGNMNPLLLLGITLMVLFLCIYPAYWGTGILGQHRTVNSACYYFIPLWFLLLHSLVSKFCRIQTIMPSVGSGRLRFRLTLLLAAVILFSGNSGTALFDFATGKVTGFDKEMSSRLAALESAKSRRLTVYMAAPLHNRPESIFVLDFQPGCSHWINFLQAHYFGLEKICTDSTGKVK